MSTETPSSTTTNTKTLRVVGKVYSVYPEKSCLLGRRPWNPRLLAIVYRGVVVCCRR